MTKAQRSTRTAAASAMATRLKKLSFKFKKKNGREPTVLELVDLYTEDMSRMQKARDYKPGGFAHMTPEQRKEASKKGVEARRKNVRKG